MSESPAKKEEGRKFQAIKGTRDILPPETALWNRVEQTAHEVFATFGFGEIRPPIFEATELFARSIGTDTDVVSKEMYSFEDREPDYPDLTDLARLNEFLRRISQAIRTNEIANSGWNRGLIERLELSSAEIAKLTREFDEDPSSSGEKLERYARVLFGAAHCARLVRLGDDVTLRPEATASVCRAYIEHGMQQLSQPVKLYYIGPMFRRERPQKGRYRQFYQIGAEVLGGPDAPAIDAEVIQMLMTFFEVCGLEGLALHINSIGDKECRPKYVELLRAELLKVQDKLGPDSQRRIEANPLRVLDSKLESEQEIIERLPRISQHLCSSCRENYDEVKRQLAMRGIAYTQNFRLVRGLDYYMRTTFEITAQGLGSQNAVCGGGRYDGLVELLGGPATKGMGFAIGEDRLILSLKESGKAQAQPGRSAGPSGRDVYIAWMGEKAYAAAIRAAKNLRAAGLSVELPPVERNFGKALGQANKLGARNALILGEDEVASGQWTLKTLADGSQRKLSESAVLEFLRESR